MIYFYLHYGNVNTNQRWKGLVNILHCTCVKIVGVIRSRSYTCTTVSYKKELHRSWWISLFFPRKDLETFFLSASLYFSVCLSVCNWNLGQNFQSLQDKTLHIIIKFEGQCQISKSGQGHYLRSEVKIVLYNFVFFPEHSISYLKMTI